MVIPYELPLLRNSTETWIGTPTVVTQGGTRQVAIYDHATHLIDTLEEYGIEEFLDLVDMEVLPLEATSGPWYVSGVAFVVDGGTGANIGVLFVLTNANGGMGDGDFFVKVRHPHTKTR